MAAKPVLTFAELAEAMRNAPPPTDDDVTILEDGRRIDSRKAALAWCAELDAAREAREHAASAQPVLSRDEWIDGLRNADPPTDDDVTILDDGRRIDSKEAALEWLGEVQARREAAECDADSEEA